jgi:hypothetical protein
LEYPTANLISLDGLKEGPEVSFTKTPITLSLDVFEKEGTHDFFRKNLKEVTFPFTIQKDPELLKLLEVFCHPGHSFWHFFIISRGHCEKLKTTPTHQSKSL